MKYLSDSAFVIRRVNFSEADRYITLFTRHFGKQEIVAKGVRKITSKRQSHLELLNKIKFHSLQTKKNYILTEVEVISTFSELKDQKGKLSAVFLICELVDKLCPVNVKHENIFNLIDRTITDLYQKDTTTVLYQFEIQLLTYLGFWDEKKEFKSSEDLESFIESIVERKIKSRLFLKL